MRPKSLPKALLFGFLLWLIPFLVAFLIFPIRLSTPALFESIMPGMFMEGPMKMGLIDYSWT